MTTLHDLAADWAWMDDAVGFIVGHRGRGRVVWETAAYPEGGTGRTVRVERLESRAGGLVIVRRYADPDASVRLVRKRGGLRP